MYRLDKYDHMILDIVATYKKEHSDHIRLAVLERNFWKRIETDDELSVGGSEASHEEERRGARDRVEGCRERGEGDLEKFFVQV